MASDHDMEGFLAEAVHGIRVNGVDTTPVPESPKKCEISPQYTQVNGFLSGSKVAFQAFIHPSGISLLDLFDAGNTGHIHGVEFPKGEVHQIYPGCGLGLNFGLDHPEGMNFGDPPVLRTAPYPDKIRCGDPGSPRNTQGEGPRFHHAFNEAPLQATYWSIQYAAFQRYRRYQRADQAGRFDLFAYQDDKWPVVIDEQARTVPSTVGWPARTFQINEYQIKMDAWAPEHLEIGELCAIYRNTKDPRAYDCAKRLVQSFLAWQWRVGDLQKAPQWDYGNLSRVMGRTLEAIGRMHRTACMALDIPFASWLEAKAYLHVARILELWNENEEKGIVTPSAQTPNSRHLSTVPWDSAFMISLIGFGAGLIWHSVETPEAKYLLDMVCDHFNEHWWNPETGEIYEDMAATGAKDGYKAYQVGGGTIDWLVWPFVAAGRTTDPFCQAVIERTTGEEPKNLFATGALP